MAIYINGTTGISGVDGSAGTPAVQGTDTNTGVFFPAADTIAWTTGGSERMRVDSSGNVGIGTSSPSYKLDVQNGTARIYNSTYPSLRIHNSTTGTASNDGLLLEMAGADANFVNYEVGNMIFKTTDTERMRIDSSGAVLIGATATGAYFDGNLNVFKSGALPASIKTDASGTYCLATWNNATSGNNLFQAFLTEGTPTVRGNIDYNRAGTAVRYNTTSDYRLKENITDADSALPLLASIKIRSFNWKETGYKVEHGVIAQELEKVAPDAVSVGDSNVDGEIERAWAVDTSTLVPALVKAIQEQQALITALTARIEALEAK